MQRVGGLVSSLLPWLRSSIVIDASGAGKQGHHTDQTPFIMSYHYTLRAYVFFLFRTLLRATLLFLLSRFVGVRFDFTYKFRFLFRPILFYCTFSTPACCEMVESSIIRCLYAHSSRLRPTFVS